MGWLEFAAAFAVFFLTHSVPVRPPVRPWLHARLGRHGFTVCYSAVSLAVLGWLIGAAGRAPFVAVWDWQPWQSWVPVAVMPAVCLIVALSVGRPNPFSFGGGAAAGFDPERPGIVRFLRHPLLAALALWAGAHLVANGDLAHVILFGTFALFAGLGSRLIDRRRRREMGSDWQRLRDRTAAGPLLPRPVSRGAAAMRAGAGLALYGVLLWLHPWLFGVAPLP